MRNRLGTNRSILRFLYIMNRSNSGIRKFCSSEWPMRSVDFLLIIWSPKIYPIKTLWKFYFECSLWSYFPFESSFQWQNRFVPNSVWNIHSLHHWTDHKHLQLLKSSLSISYFLFIWITVAYWTLLLKCLLHH